MKQIISLLPDVYAAQLDQKLLETVEEIRLAVGVPLWLRRGNTEKFLWPKMTQPQLERVLHAACQQSIYAYTETLRNGYITLDSGHRVGICGFGVVRNGEVLNIHTPSSMLIRVAHEVPGCASHLIDQLQGSTLIIGPPGSGKTTLLRDCIRLLSDQKQMRIGVVDERGEIAACRNGVPQLEIGKRTDVMINVPKADAMTMLLRTMSVQWIAVDEITSPQDCEVMEQASFCGVHLLATAHSTSMQELYARPLYRKLMERHIFSYVVTMEKDKTYHIEEVQN